MEQRADKISALGQRDQQSMIAARINDAEMSYVSKAFLLRYCEEEIEIGETVMFRSELDVEPDYLMTEYFLETELYFSDLVTAGGPEYWQTADLMKAKFKKVQTQTCQVNMLAQGVIEYAPIKFTDHYYSTLNLCLQSVLVDYRFRTKTIFELVPPPNATNRMLEEQQTTNKDVRIGAGLPF